MGNGGGGGGGTFLKSIVDFEDALDACMVIIGVFQLNLYQLRVFRYEEYLYGVVPLI